MKARERGIEVKQPSQYRCDLRTNRPGMVRISIHKTESFDGEFLCQALMRVFSKSSLAAQVIVRTAELTGSADCGLYSRQVAETKVDEIRLNALRRQIRIDMRLSGNDDVTIKAK